MNKFISEAKIIEGSLIEYKHPVLTIDDMDFSVRTYNCLARDGLVNIDDIIKQSFEDMSSIRNLGRNSLIEIQTTINKHYNYPLIKWVALVSYY